MDPDQVVELVRHLLAADEGGAGELVRRLLAESAVGDAVMLRQVVALRELVREVDRGLELLQRFFTPPAVADQMPPS